MVEVQCEMLQINLALSRLRFLHAVRCFFFYLTFKPSSEMQHLKYMNSVVTQPLSVEIFKVYGTNSCTCNIYHRTPEYQIFRYHMPCYTCLKICVI